MFNLLKIGLCLLFFCTVSSAQHQSYNDLIFENIDVLKYKPSQRKAYMASRQKRHKAMLKNIKKGH